MIAGLAPSVAFALVAIALFAGVGITAIGPGGIFLTAALFALTGLPTATVAGTASATFVATGALGAAAYVRSDHLGDRVSVVAGGLLSLGGLVGALVGVRLNAVVSERLFGLLLGAFLSLSGLLVWYRSRTPDREAGGLDASTWRGRATLSAIGLAVGIPGGLLGVGGPVLAVPLLVVAGVPLLLAVGLAQVQSVFLAASATAGYLAQGAVDWRLALLVGIPELVGVVAGWRLAREQDPERLKRLLAGLLVVLGPYVALP